MLSSLPLIILRLGVHSRQRFSRRFDLGIHGMADRAVVGEADPRPVAVVEVADALAVCRGCSQLTAFPGKLHAVAVGKGVADFIGRNRLTVIAG